MEERIEIGPMRPEEAGEVSELAIEVFNRFVAPGYGEKGRRVFLTFASPSRITLALDSGNDFLVARRCDEIVGFIEIRDSSHIVMLFVGEAHQKRGIGRSLVKRAKSGAAKTLTVNAAPDAVCIYERLGFRRTGETQENDGIIFTPMSSRMDGCPFQEKGDADVR